MIELGQLEKHHEEFARRNTRVIVISVEEPGEAKKTQDQFPHLLVLADHTRDLTEKAKLIHTRAAPDGSDAATPTTFVADRQGILRWGYRSREGIARLAPEEGIQPVAQQP